ncbi:glycoside hydrolase family 71/99-like protein [Hufsiella ginkgonis]|uniref:Xylosidase n=1 Tax=Hufsiella ginkgonis TaxID=2695274 RepID=A0A7K1XSX4_9SPHI|nr:glycoside hydrolase family 71/99-like protein [Hufsiella ginkgonis]MXV14054.1 xylosidase [Hufsiella ginkgonis]
MKKNQLLCLTALFLLIAGCSKNAGEAAGTEILPGAKGSAATLASPAGDVVGKVTTGYQGWFGAAGDGSPLNSWQHMNLESWPDVREYLNTYSGTPFNQGGVGEPGFTGNLGNGQPARMFSSWSSQTVAKHMQWMQQYGIDCVALQRFGSYMAPGAKKNFFDQVVAKARNSAETYGRKFYIMYDCSATDACEADWTSSMKTHTNSSAYAKQNGKPVVCFWGVGKSGRGTMADWVTKINWFKAQGCYVIGGVLQGWRGNADMSAYLACDMIMPWMVGKTTGFQGWYADDLAWCNANGKDYQADIYPGTAFYNTNGASSPKNQIKRAHGDFMWSQFAAARNANVKSVYISMFDELNEATQIMKTAENASMIPAGKYFLTLDADGVSISSDFYLRLTNDGVKMVKGLTGYTATHPTSHR